ncbi:MAG: HAMP domain-containing sensor histidine kinase [Pseudomonadota bacterium]
MNSTGPELPTVTDLRAFRRAPPFDSATIDAMVASRVRLAAVQQTRLLDSPPDEAFDSLSRLATRLLDVPVAFFSVVAADRDFYKSQHGFGPPLSEERQLGGRTFCHYALAGEDPLVIDDTHSHEVWRAVPTVASLGVRAYIGIPISLDGQVIGSFCVLDMKPRAWTDDEIETLRQLGASAARELALRHALTAARLEAAKANALALAREEVVAVVAHDLRTPLQVLSLGTQVVQRALLGQQESTTARMIKAVDALRAMADSLLSTNALLTPAAQALAPFDIAELARDAINMMTPIAERASIRVVAGPLPSAIVRLDYAQMVRVLGNLIGNAIKYSPAGCEVSVSVEKAGSSLTLEVRDNGKGMTAQEQSQAFERGWQGAEGMARGDGAGLGLAIARTLVEQHDGAIAITGAPGVGTTVTITLSCDPEAAGVSGVARGNET